MERLNFASAQLGDVNKPGVRAIIDQIVSENDGVVSPEALVDSALDQLGVITVSDDTRTALISFVAQGGKVELDNGATEEETRSRIAQVLQLVGSSYEFQRA